METAAVIPPAFQPIMLNIEDSARLLGATPWAVRRMLYAGTLPFKKVGKRLCIPREALEDFARKDLVREGVQTAPRGVKR